MKDEGGKNLTDILAIKLGTAVAREFHRPKSMRREEVSALIDDTERRVLMLVSVRAGNSVGGFSSEAGGGSGVEIHVEAVEVEDRHDSRVDIRDVAVRYGVHELQRYGLRETWSQYVEES